MECIYLQNLTGYEKQIWEILRECDHEFVPPLSARNSSTQKNLIIENTGNGADEEPTAYMEELKKQYFIIAREGDEVLGFITCIPEKPINIEPYDIAEYLTTIIVRPSARRKNVAKNLYIALIEHCSSKKIVTRTWSTNEAHIHLLGRLGFDEIQRIKDDRGAGIDTVYFGKEI